MRKTSIIIMFSVLVVTILGMSFRLKTKDTEEIFQQKSINGSEYLYAPGFPTQYASDLDDLSGKIMRPTKGKNTFRIFFYGASAVAGSPYGHWASFPNFLDRQLNFIKSPDTEVEVINFGHTKYNSNQVADLAAATLTYNPDIIVVSLNEHSDIGERKPLDSALMAKAFGYLSGLAGANIRSGSFEENMRFIAEQAASRHIPVVFVSQMISLMYRPTTADSNERALYDSYESGNFTDASQRALSILKDDPVNSAAQFCLGNILVSRGRTMQGRNLLVQALLNDRDPQHLFPSSERIQKKIADPARGIYFVDTTKQAEAYLDDRIIDGRLLSVGMHPNVTGYKIMAEAIFQQFFLNQKYRPDLFDYDSYEKSRLWSIDVPVGMYARVCPRMFRNADAIIPLNCAKLLYKAYTGSKTPDEKRRTNLAWEFLYFAGLQLHRPDLTEKSGKIFISPNNIEQDTIPQADLIAGADER